MGFGTGVVNGSDRIGIAYVKRYGHEGDYSWNPNNYPHGDTAASSPASSAPRAPSAREAGGASPIRHITERRYRWDSDVRIATTREGYDRMCRFVDAASEDRKPYQLLGVRRQPEFYDEHDGCAVFGWDSIKWYEGSLPDVTAVCDALSELDKADVPYEFCRVGESYDDIEFESRNDNEALLMHAYPDVTIEIAVG